MRNEFRARLAVRPNILKNSGTTSEAGENRLLFFKGSVREHAGPTMGLIAGLASIFPLVATFAEFR